jgi:hypothetical protein
MNIKYELAQEWNKPKAKNAKPGQIARDESKIQQLIEMKNLDKKNFKAEQAADDHVFTGIV